MFSEEIEAEDGTGGAKNTTIAEANDHKSALRYRERAWSHHRW